MPIDLLAQAEQPRDLLASSEPVQSAPSGDQGGFKDSALVSAAAGFNQGMENILLGAVQTGAALTDKVLNTDLTGHVGKVKENLDKGEQAYIDANPIAGAIGQGVGSIVATAPTMLIPGAGPTSLVKLGSQGLAQGAITGALLYTDDGTITSHLANAAIGGAIGGSMGAAFAGAKDLVKAGVNAASTYTRGLQAGKDSARQFIMDATDGVAKKLSPANPDVSAKNVIDSVNESFDKVAAVKNAKYMARDAAAAKSGISVPTDNVNLTIQDIASQMGTRMSPEERSILSTLNSFGGEDPISVKESYNLLKRVGNLRQASLATDSNKARLLGQVQDALQLDVDSAIAASGNDVVKGLHNDAQTFYKETFLPIKEVAKSKAMDQLTEDAWVANIVNKSKTSAGLNASLDTLGGDIKQQIAGAHMNSVKMSLTDPITGIIDFHGYVSEFNKSLLKNPAFADVAAPIGNLSKVTEVVRKATMDRGQGLSTILGVGTAVASGSVIGGGATFLAGQVPKATAMYTLGKIVSSPEIVSLLGTAKNVDSMAAPIKAEVMKKVLGTIGSIVNNKTATALTTTSLLSVSASGKSLGESEREAKIAAEQEAIDQRNPSVSVGGIRG